MMHLLGRLAWFAGLGLAALILVGPVVGIAGALLPFAIVGVLVWGGYRGVQRLLGVSPHKREPRLAVIEVKQAPAPVVEVPRHRPVSRRSSRAGRVFLEMTLGALLAGVVVGAFCWESPNVAETIAAAIVAGAVVGYVVGQSSPQQISEHSPSCSPDRC